MLPFIRSFGLIFLFLFICSGQRVSERDASGEYLEASSDATLLQRFYQYNNGRLFWLVNDEEHCGLRNALIHCIDSIQYKTGLESAKYNKARLQDCHQCLAENKTATMAQDQFYTTMAIRLAKDIYMGSDIHKWTSYDGLSARYREADEEYLLTRLVSVESAAHLQKFVQELEPTTPQYRALKLELADCMRDNNPARIRQLSTSMNYYRWIWHFQLDSFIVVNIGSAMLSYHKKDSILFTMKAVLGESDRRTPRFAAYCKEVTLYPFWNMPRSIAVNEWLPSIKRNPRQLKELAMEIIDSKGRVVSPEKINWSAMSSTHFPYRFRQQPGCLNPMGVIKFTLTNPFDIYIHDTNNLIAFQSSNRYYSHGCIRIQNPVLLANALLQVAVDTNYLRACYRMQVPQSFPVPNPVPVFVVYMTAEADNNGSVHYFRDTYRLLK